MALAHGIRASLRNNGQAYGFSVSITAGLAMLNASTRQPGAVHILYFVLGAAAAFSLLEGLVSAGFRKPLEEEPSTVTALGISLSFRSVTTSVALAQRARESSDSETSEEKDTGKEDDDG